MDSQNGHRLWPLEIHELGLVFLEALLAPPLQANDFWQAAANAPAPLSIFAAKEPGSTVRTFARARFRKLGARIMVDDEAGHLAPMQKPRELAAFLAS